MGWNDCYTTWTKDGKNKKPYVLAARLIEIIEMTSDRRIPDCLELGTKEVRWKAEGDAITGTFDYKGPILV